MQIVSRVVATISPEYDTILTSYMRTPTNVTHLSGLRAGLLLLLDRRGGLSPRDGERPLLFHDCSSFGPPLDRGASPVGMLMPPPLLGGAMSWDCQAEDRGGQGKGEGGNGSQVLLLDVGDWHAGGTTGDGKEKTAHHQKPKTHCRGAHKLRGRGEANAKTES